MAPARQGHRRIGGAAWHAGGLSRAQDRRDRRPGESALHHERGEILRGHRAGGADRTHDPAGVLRCRQAALGQARAGPEDAARRRRRPRRQAQ